jgi:hypothetical protein
MLHHSKKKKILKQEKHKKLKKEKFRKITESKGVFPNLNSLPFICYIYTDKSGFNYETTPIVSCIADHFKPCMSCPD